MGPGTSSTPYERFLTRCAGIVLASMWAGWASADGDVPGGIDRQALVARHNVVLHQPDPLTPLSVGNGEFAFTADITGLQTFPEYHQQGMSLGRSPNGAGTACRIRKATRWRMP